MNRALRAEGDRHFIAATPAMRSVLELLHRIGPSNANVLITGERGTGKEVITRALIVCRMGGAGTGGGQHRRALGGHL